MPKHSRSLIEAIKGTVGDAPKLIAEVGIFEGENAVELVRAFPQTQFWFFDPWEALPDGHRFSDSRFAKLSHEKINVVRKQANVAIREAWLDGWEALDLKAQVDKAFRFPHVVCLADETMPNSWFTFFRKSFNAVFIDAHHDYESVIDSIRIWERMVKPDGILAFHDYNSPKYHGVKQAVDEFAAGFGDAEVHTAAGRVAWIQMTVPSTLEEYAAKHMGDNE